MKLGPLPMFPGYSEPRSDGGDMYTQSDRASIEIAISRWYRATILRGGEPTAEQQEAINLLSTASIPPYERLYDGFRCPNCGYLSPKQGLPFGRPELYVGQGLLDPDVIALYPKNDLVD